ncbi:MAG: RhsD protein [Alphaproteobacteria bacterium]|nr:RhsD protein [Alphaproteobacteria bacterium]
MRRNRFMKRLPGNLLILAVLATLVMRGMYQRHATPSPTGHAPVLDAQHRRHILYGDAHGGGHLHGMGKPCKSEFPASWSADVVIATVTRDAANDNLPWRLEDNGYEVADVNEGGVVIRIVIDRGENEIITAYPVNMPRNACPGRRGYH